MDGDGMQAKILFCQSAGKDKGSSESAGEMTAASQVVVTAVAYRAGIVSMAGAGEIAQLFIIAAMLIRIRSNCTNRSAGRNTVAQTR